jgi:AcrR family transcriptional regulator
MPHVYQRSEVRQRQIAEAALQIIAEHGLAKFTVAALAKQLPITGGTIFRHFENKERIVLAAIERLAEDLFPSEHLGDARERLREFFELRARLLAAPGSIGRLVFSGELGRAAGDEGMARISALRRDSAEFVQTCLRDMRGVDYGGLRLREDVSPLEATRLLLGMLFTFRADLCLFSSSDGESDSTDARIRASWDTIERLFLINPKHGVTST